VLCSKGLSLCAVVFLSCSVAGFSVLLSQTPLTTLQGTQGGVIVYGVVDGASTPAMAMAHMLRNLQRQYGDKPHIGRVFRLRGSNSDAVIFTVTNHLHGNQLIAGMLIASRTGPQQVEAAQVSDAAAHFRSTVNPLLKQLFGVWHPDAAAEPEGKASAGHETLPGMRQVRLADDTAAISLPAGWSVDAKSGGGTALVRGPQGEAVMMNSAYAGQDPRAPSFQQQMRFGARTLLFVVVYPSDVDLARSFADLLQRIRATRQLRPAPLRLDRVAPLGQSQGQCVKATGQVDGDGAGMKEMMTLLCRDRPNQNGVYTITVSQYQLPLGATDLQRATAEAIMASFQLNEPVLRARMAADSARVQAILRAHEQMLLGFVQQQIAHTRQIGADVMERARAADIEHERQHRNWRQGEEDIPRYGQGFSNYILEQSVVQYNGPDGAVAHATMWNNFAEQLVKLDPSRFEYVPTPNYWAGTDFVP